MIEDIMIRMMIALMAAGESVSTIFLYALVREYWRP